MSQLQRSSQKSELIKTARIFAIASHVYIDANTDEIGKENFCNIIYTIAFRNRQNTA